MTRHNCEAGEKGGVVVEQLDPSQCSLIDWESTIVSATIENSSLLYEEELPFVDVVEDNFKLSVEIEIFVAADSEAETVVVADLKIQ